MAQLHKRFTDEQIKELLQDTPKGRLDDTMSKRFSESREEGSVNWLEDTKKTPKASPSSIVARAEPVGFPERLRAIS